MKNKWLLLTIFLFFVLCFSPSILSSVYGQANQTEVRDQLKKICLKGAGASDLQKTVSETPTANIDVSLTGTGFGNAHVVYVALCLPSEKKSVCSTGDSVLDKEIFGADFTNDLKNVDANAGSWSTYNYGVKNTGNLGLKIVKNKLTPVDGKISTSATMSNALGHFVYPFYGFYQPPGTVEIGQAGGDQQGILNFDADSKNCTTILWDPYGRIFDSKSLEPIPDITVKVLTSISPLEKLTQIFGNPQTTFADGAFNFLVEPDTYYLRLVNPPTKYSFIATPNLNSNYSKTYSKRDGTNSIYKPDDPIVEVAGKPEHRDIPLDPGNNPPGHFPLVNMTSFGYDQMVFGDSTKYGGKISHPFSIVALVGQKTHKEVARITSDKFGFWSVGVENNSIPQNEPLLIKLIKVDLTTMIPDEKNGRITNDVTFYPIARKINGYIYDNGKIAPNTPIAVTLENNNKPFYQTTADNNGYVSIPSNNLPNFSYNLIVKFVGTNITKQLSTDVFAQENKTYLEKNNINLMVQDVSQNKSASQQGKDNNNQSGNINNALNPSQNLPNSTTQSQSTADNQKKDTLFIIISLFIGTFIVLTVLVVLYLKRKNTNYQDGSTIINK